MEQTERQLVSLLSEITPLYDVPMREAKARQDALAKPPGSLGLLEDLSVQLAGITGQVKNEVSHTRIYVLAADNGVVCEGVSSAPQSVTRAQAINLTRGLTGASCLAKHFGDELVVADMGIALPYACPEILNRSLGKGTANIAAGPAMARQTAVRGILTGMGLAAQAKRDGIQILGVGEMGIGNTTTSSAVLCALSGKPVEAVTGRGGGLTDAAFLKKKQVIEQALAINTPDGNDPVDVLHKVGGLDLCAMAGVFLGAAHERLPVVVDGFISVVAALCAARLCEAAKGFFIGSHVSYERGYEIAARLLGLRPCLQLGMRLGEGSGCPLAFRVVEAACAVMNTTTSSAVLCALSGKPVEAVTGRGGGLTDAAFLKKKQVIEQALAINTPDGNDPVDVLHKVGGLDLCAMAGVFLGAAHERLPVVVDGFISVVAALCAARLCEAAKGFFIGSHVSYERGYEIAARLLGLRPCLQLGMRLGEGSGCPLAFRVVEAACAVMNTMATFPEAAIDDGYLTEIRERDSFTV